MRSPVSGLFTTVYFELFKHLFYDFLLSTIDVEHSKSIARRADRTYNVTIRFLIPRYGESNLMSFFSQY
jgi:hypothetical protein